MKAYIDTIPFSIIFIAIFMFNGCVTKNFTHTNSAFIVFKTPNFKFADTSFVRYTKSSVTLELYEASNAVTSLEISEKNICQSEFKCMSAKEFNRRYLHTSYPDNTLYRIVTGSKLPKTLQKDGIVYDVDTQTIRFSDKKNSILIKIRKL